MPPKVFKGQTFAISGKLSQPRKEYDDLIRKHGGEVASSVSKDVTVLISNHDDVKAGSTKVVTAQGRGTPIVQEGFIGACIAAKKLLDISHFLVKVAGKKRKVPTKSVPKTEAVKKSKTEPSAPASVTFSKNVPVFSKSGLGDKAGVVVEEVSKGFMKASLTWDVELVLHDPSAGKDKYYCMQLLADLSGASQFWAVQHWGKTGMPGRLHIDGPYTDILEAKRVFRKKYRQKTGSTWGQLAGSSVEHSGKYTVVVKDIKKETEESSGRWQYYLHNKVDGKKIGWYDYEGESATNMEKYWKQLCSNKGLDIRLVQSDYFKYEINFTELIQTNTKSGTRRAIRRIPAGEHPSQEPPSKIPAPVKPVAPPAEESDDEEEMDDEDGEEEEEEDEEPAEEEGEAEGEEEDGDATEKEDAGHAEKTTGDVDADAETDDGGVGAEAAAPKAGGRASPAAAAATTPSTVSGRLAASPSNATTLPTRKPAPAPAVDEMEAETLPMCG